MILIRNIGEFAVTLDLGLVAGLRPCPPALSFFLTDSQGKMSQLYSKDEILGSAQSKAILYDPLTPALSHVGERGKGGDGQ